MLAVPFKVRGQQFFFADFGDAPIIFRMPEISFEESIGRQETVRKQVKRLGLREMLHKRLKEILVDPEARKQLVRRIAERQMEGFFRFMADVDPDTKEQLIRETAATEVEPFLHLFEEELQEKERLNEALNRWP